MRNPQQPPATPPAPTTSVVFRATIPPKAAAIDVHGQEGARLTLDVSDADLPAFLPVVLLRGKVLRVTLEVET